MNKLGGDKRFVRSPVNEDVGVFTKDMVNVVQGLCDDRTPELALHQSSTFKVHESGLTLGKSKKRKTVPNARNKLAD